MNRSAIKRTGAAAAVAMATVGAGAVLADAGTAGPPAKSAKAKRPPIKVTLFSPGKDDRAGRGGVGFTVDLALDATSRQANKCLSAKAGYRPLFRDPLAPGYGPGTDPAAPGLIVMLSSTPTMPGTPFKGPRTNLAGLFQVNGVANVDGLAETWNTWHPAKPLFGLNKRAKLTVYAVKGTAPALVPAHGTKKISNTVNRSFTINR